MTVLTPVEERDGIFFKRDDLYHVSGSISGGKARAAMAIGELAAGGYGKMSKTPLITAGAKGSRQPRMVAEIAKHYGVACRLHVPTGFMRDERPMPEGTEIIEHFPGYGSVLKRRLSDDNNGFHVHFMMECNSMRSLTAEQVRNVPFDKVKRIVVPVGSGMSLSGIITGLHDMKVRHPILGVMVGGKSAVERIYKWAGNAIHPDDLTLVRSPDPYGTITKDATINGIDLDPIYEAKCIPFLEKGDLLWIVGPPKVV